MEMFQFVVYSGSYHVSIFHCLIFKVMLSCARIITLITPCFLSDDSCLEQYNIALCCTRNMKRDYLAPLYVETIDPMPTYMSLIQYIDCR